MATSILNQLCSIRDVLDEKEEPICAAHLQLVIDTLSTRAGFESQGDLSDESQQIKDGFQEP
ncbi:hypothetical protein J3454_15575 [Erythrobacter sp. NFXS35]|uniref:hypothetical protein n=1 Tax=Erythrobacter sp. NFXS35 TaxID=2818436 RepID=UPI0032DE6405